MEEEVGETRRDECLFVFAQMCFTDLCGILRIWSFLLYKVGILNMHYSYFSFTQTQSVFFIFKECKYKLPYSL